MRRLLLLLAVAELLTMQSGCLCLVWPWNHDDTYFGQKWRELEHSGQPGRGDGQPDSDSRSSQTLGNAQNGH
jgi:hypothetical protein